MMPKLGPDKLPDIMFNTNTYYDIPTSNLIVGVNGETIVNGGINGSLAIIGSGNNYKSTKAHELLLAAANNILATSDVDLYTLDTECSLHVARVEYFASRYPHMPLNPVTVAKIWNITDKKLCNCNQWVSNFITLANAKQKATKEYIEYTAFTDYQTGKVIRMPKPCVTEIDSLSELTSNASEESLTGDLEDKATNMFAMSDGIFRYKFLSLLPRLCGISNTAMIMTLQINKKNSMKSGADRYTVESKQLQYLNNGDNISGGTNKSNYLTNGGSVFMHTATKLHQKGTRLPEYPSKEYGDDPIELNKVLLTQLRGKNNSSGWTYPYMVSQYEGVQYPLSQFNYIRTSRYFGLSGGTSKYRLDLYPDVTLSRTTIRDILEEDPLVAKSTQFTSDLLQLNKHYRSLNRVGLICSPEELRHDIIKLGYNWNDLLETRSFMTPDQYSSKIPPYLSIVDLLKIRKGQYKPYWL